VCPILKHCSWLQFGPVEMIEGLEMFHLRRKNHLGS
jgi:hypothetical protein